MERRAGEPGRPWRSSLRLRLRAVLWAASILHPHILLTQAGIWPETEIPVTWEPSQPRTRDNLTLTPGGALRTPRSCSWYRGGTTAKEKKIISTSFFLAVRHKKRESHTGRETVGPNCSLHIRNLTALDSGNYTVKKKGRFCVEIGHAYVEISDPSLSSPGIVSGVVLGLLLAVTAGIGALLYFFLRGRKRSSWWRIGPNGPIRAPTQPVSNIYHSHERPASTYLADEYILTSTREEPWTQVESSNAFDTGQRYQILHVQDGNQDVYHDLRKPYPPPPGSSSWPPVSF
ncbi:UNVERIFIED_CONTAM: hypothetical protein K2H54_031795 [Gekko kuhli]